MYKLLSESNYKTEKGVKQGVLTVMLSLAPARISGKNVCPYSKIANCEKSCIYYSGRGYFSNVQNARIEKAKLFHNAKDLFMSYLVLDVEKAIKKSNKLGLKLGVRLNGFSDIDFSKILINGKNIFNTFPTVQFYDYTKAWNRAIKAPKNYHLTLSWSDNLYTFWKNKLGKKTVTKLIKDNNIAVVFNNELPNKFLNKKVVNGDLSDTRFLDNKNSIIGLKIKGKKVKVPSFTF